jgi:hypothetical protein
MITVFLGFFFGGFFFGLFVCFCFFLTKRIKEGEKPVKKPPPPKENK